MTQLNVRRLADFVNKWQMQMHIPAPALCTDNGVMIAWAAAERLLSQNRLFSRANAPENVLNYLPKWPLENYKSILINEHS